MSFVYAEKLKREYQVLGHFYDLKIGDRIFNCRSLLEIISLRKRYNLNSLPDSVVVMMNPGSSRPLDNKYEPKKHSVDEILSGSLKKEIIPTRPDNAQYQIMRVMKVNGWEHVRVLNLSDLRNGNSGDFSQEFQLAGSIDSEHPHCITHPSREFELKELLTRDGPLIAAWGSVEILRKSAKALLNRNGGVVGIKASGGSPWYRYASPYMKKQKLTWLSEINEEIQKHNKAVPLDD